jgi:hypothetical protein
MKRPRKPKDSGLCVTDDSGERDGVWLIDSASGHGFYIDSRAVREVAAWLMRWVDWAEGGRNG